MMYTPSRPKSIADWPHCVVSRQNIRASLTSNACVSRFSQAKLVEDFFHGAGRIREFLFAVASVLKPFPLTPDARAALHHRRRVVKHMAEPCERNSAEKQRVAQQHQREKCRAAQDALGPLQHGRRQPVARQKRKHGESRLGEQQIERLQRALVEQVVVTGWAFHKNAATASKTMAVPTRRFENCAGPNISPPKSPEPRPARPAAR